MPIYQLKIDLFKFSIKMLKYSDMTYKLTTTKNPFKKKN